MDDYKDYDPGYDKWLDARLDDHLETSVTSKRERIRAERRRKRKAVQARKGKGPNLNSAGAISTTIVTALMLDHLLHPAKTNEQGE